MDAAVADPRSASYDQAIQAELKDYAIRLGSTPGFNAPAFKLVKALLIVESGGPSTPAWHGRVAQIGNSGDPGYGVLRRGEQNSDLVMGPTLKSDLAVKPITEPVLNLRAAIALIFTMAVGASTASVIDPKDPQLHQHVAVKGDTFGRIARTEGSTIPDLRSSNPPSAYNLHPKDRIAFHHASMQRQITGWRVMDAAFLATRYNGGGDPDYQAKLNYVASVLK